MTWSQSDNSPRPGIPRRRKDVNDPLHAYRILDTPPEPAFDEIVQRVARLFGTTHAEMSMVTADRVWLKGALSGEGASNDPGNTLCTSVAADQQTILVPDALLSTRFAHHPRVARANGLRFYAGVPLIAPNGTVLGALCAWDERPLSPSRADIAELEFYGRQVVDLLELRRISRQLTISEALQDATRALLELIVEGAELATVLDTLVLAVEACLDSTRGSILLVDGMVLHHGAAPSLPESYRNAIDGVRIGPNVGSCGTAAYTRETVIVSDIATDPRWTDYRDVALPVGLLACWSVPIQGRDGHVLGTFAFYYDEIRTPTPDELRQVSQWVNLAEVAISRARDVATLRDAATLDALTGLTNRAEALRRLQVTVATPDSRFAVLFVDLDQLKFVNDTLGHTAGDRFLQAVAARLTGCAGPAATIARFGGDEFLLLCPGVDSLNGAEALGREIVEVLKQPLTIYGHAVALSASVGIAVHPPRVATGSSDLVGDTGPSDLVGDADLAMYAAKRSGRNSVTVFTQDLREQAAARLMVEADLSMALAEGQFDCAFQPMVDISTGQVTAVEALLRWNSPTHGQIPPLKFIPAAEESGQIIAIGEFVLERACLQLVNWRAEGDHWHDIVMWVNISPRQLRDPGFTELVEQLLARTGLPAANLGLEVTESTLIDDPRSTSATLSSLRGRGIQVAVDDFGTGYSSMAQLKHLPVDVLKIDQQFIAEISSDPVNASIVAAIIALGRALGLQVTAEGVETQEQRSKLLALGCISGQGYLWSAPVGNRRLAEIVQPAPALLDHACRS